MLKNFMKSLNMIIQLLLTYSFHEKKITKNVFSHIYDNNKNWEKRRTSLCQSWRPVHKWEGSTVNLFWLQFSMKELWIKKYMSKLLWGWFLHVGLEAPAAASLIHWFTYTKLSPLFWPFKHRYKQSFQ